MNHFALYDPLIRERDLCARLGISRSTIFRWERAGYFPHRLKLGPKAVAWRKSDIDSWLAARSQSIASTACEEA